MNEKTDLMPREENMLEKHQELPQISPVVDIYENEDEILLYANMPGVIKDNLSIHVDNGTLEISGARHLETKGSGNWQEFGDVEYRRVFSVPQSIDVAKVHAELKEGVLKIHLPKTKAIKPNTIKINAL